MNILLFFIVSLVETCYTTPELQLVNVIFRHGDRTPTYEDKIPTDPNDDLDFHPIGYGGLTNTGKLRSFELGEFLRQRYGTFIGDLYFPDLIYARATESERVRMSLQLVLAALFPPSEEQTWHKNLDWQPIPISYIPSELDDLLLAITHSAWAAEEERALNAMKCRIDSFTEFMSQLTNFTGKQITTPSDMKRVYDTLSSEQNMELTLPDWSEGIFPDGKLLEGAILYLDAQAHDAKILHFLNGKLISKITNDMLTVKDKKEIGKRDTRLFLYSGHDVNVNGILRSLQVYKPHIPYYSSAVIIEMLKEHNQYYVKVLYYHGNTSHIEELEMPGCSKLCPFGKYLAIMDYLLNFEKESTCSLKNEIYIE